ncbi:unnamed protein product [Polarella glacialis]|uniref:Uncharacterized protein n=1 Tax=Polarella glacialis TaxID=89957 RepID=A0A813H9W5_POLGL|nr:unnamed protein product [Polarella glacialis]
MEPKAKLTPAARGGKGDVQRPVTPDRERESSVSKVQLLPRPPAPEIPERVIDRVSRWERKKDDRIIMKNADKVPVTPSDSDGEVYPVNRPHPQDVEGRSRETTKIVLPVRPAAGAGSRSTDGGAARTVGGSVRPAAGAASSSTDGGAARTVGGSAATPGARPTDGGAARTVGSAEIAPRVGPTDGGVVRTVGGVANTPGMGQTVGGAERTASVVTSRNFVPPFGSLPSSEASSTSSGSSAAQSALPVLEPLVPQRSNMDIPDMEPYVRQVLPQRSNMDMPDMMPLVPNLRRVDNAGQFIEDDGPDLIDYRSCGHDGHDLHVAGLRFDTIIGAPSPFLGVESCTDAGAGMDTNGSLPARLCTKCAWVGTNPGGLVSCPCCSSGGCMTEGTPPTQRRTAWFELYQILVGAHQTMRNKVREALELAEFWMRQTEMVVVSSNEIVASWNAQRLGSQRELMNGDFDRVFSMLASEKGNRFIRDVARGENGFTMALQEESVLDEGADKLQRKKLYQYSETIDFELECQEYVYVGVKTKFLGLYLEYGLGAGEDDVIRAAGKYEVMGEFCGLPAAQGPETASDTTIIQLNLKMMVDDGMIWNRSMMTPDGQTVFVSRGCNGSIAPYYIERAFLRGVTADDVYSCGPNRAKASATWERIQSQGTCKYLKCFERSAVLRDAAVDQIMYFVEATILFPLQMKLAIGTNRRST